jgi:NAD(P)-dependent dehydrogenase (short-subunit alcohol dehydrogenase family)
MQLTAVITGASRGLGLSLTKKFLDAGWRVYGVSRTKAHWKEAQKKWGSSKDVSLHAFDVTSEPAVKAFAQKFKGKRIDLLINNAGYGGRLMNLDKTPLSEYKKLMDANLLSVFLMSKHFIPLFRRHKIGTILNISSMAGQRAVPGVAIYSASKFGVLALSQAIAKENADIPLKCVTVCPGGMNTEMREAIFGKADAEKQQRPDYVADVIFDVYHDKVQVESGGDIVIRHGQITAIHPCPQA